MTTRFFISSLLAVVVYILSSSSTSIDSATTIESLPDDILDRIIYNRKLDIKERAALSRTSHLFKSGIESLSTYLSRTVSMYRELCDPGNEKINSPFPYDINGGFLLLHLDGNTTRLDCYTHIFKNIRAFLPIKEIQFGNDPHRPSFENFAPRTLGLLYDTLSADESFRKSVEALYLWPVSLTRHSYTDDLARDAEIRKTILSKYISIFELLPNVKMTDPDWVSQASDELFSLDKNYLEKIVAALSKKKVMTSIMLTDTMDTLDWFLNSEYSISTWPSISFICFNTTSSKEQKDYSDALIREISLMKRDLSVRVNVALTPEAPTSSIHQIAALENIKQVHFEYSSISLDIAKDIFTTILLRKTGLKSLSYQLTTDSPTISTESYQAYKLLFTSIAQHQNEFRSLRYLAIDVPSLLKLADFSDSLRVILSNKALKWFHLRVNAFPDELMTIEKDKLDAETAVFVASFKSLLCAVSKRDRSAPLRLVISGIHLGTALVHAMVNYYMSSPPGLLLPIHLRLEVDSFDDKINNALPELQKWYRERVLSFRIKKIVERP